MFRDLISRFRALSLGNKIATVAFIAVAVAFGGSKPVMSWFRFMTGLRGDGCYVDGETVHVEWVKTGEVYIPDNADLYVDAREHGDTNDANWQLVAQTTVGAYMVDFFMPTNAVYDFNVWYYYASDPVTTNGVWKYEAKRARGNPNRIVPVRAVVTGDGQKLTPGGFAK